MNNKNVLIFLIILTLPACFSYSPRTSDLKDKPDLLGFRNGKLSFELDGDVRHSVSIDPSDSAGGFSHCFPLPNGSLMCQISVLNGLGIGQMFSFALPAYDATLANYNVPGSNPDTSGIEYFNPAVEEFRVTNPGFCNFTNVIKKITKCQENLHVRI